MNIEEATKRITFEYLKTSCEGYQKLLQYIHGNIKGNLYLFYTKVSYLPDGLKVSGSLYLDHTHITSLPEGLVVRGTLDLRHTPISKKYTIKQLKQMLPNVNRIVL